MQHPGDAYHQTLTAIGVIEKAIAQVGVSLSDVVRTRCYVSNAEAMDDVARAHGEIFGEIRPALTILSGVAFVDPAMLVEIEADCYSRDIRK